MPVLSSFYGITVAMYYLDNRRHSRPHIHARFQDSEVVIAIPEGDVLEGGLPPGKMHLVLAWVEIHQAELTAAWSLAVKGEKPPRIRPLV